MSRNSTMFLEYMRWLKEEGLLLNTDPDPDDPTTVILPPDSTARAHLAAVAFRAPEVEPEPDDEPETLEPEG